MSKKLKGGSTLNVENVPVPRKEKIGLLNETKYLTKTYRITISAVEALDELTERLSKEARIDLAKSKVLELVIFNAVEKSLDELLK